MGQRFPLVPDLTAGEVPEKVQEAIEVVSGNVFPSMVHAMFQVESQGLEDVDEVLRSNSQLFRFLHGIVERGERMARLVQGLHPHPAGRAGHVRRLLLRRHGTRRARPSRPSPRAC